LALNDSIPIGGVCMVAEYEWKDEGDDKDDDFDDDDEDEDTDDEDEF